MHKVRIANWNSSNVFSEGDPALVKDLMGRDNPDMLFVPEAYLAKDRDAPAKIQNFAKETGHKAVTADYDYDQDRPAEHGFAVFVKDQISKMVDIEFVWAGDMNAMRADFDMRDESLTALGVHLNDRSNELREQIIPLLSLQYSPDNPTVIFGDMNDMHRERGSARFLRNQAVGSLAWAGTRVMPSKTRNRIMDIYNRLSMMAEGEKTEYLEVVGFRDVDTDHQATIPVQRPLVQIDRFMANDLVESSDFQNYKIAHGSFSISKLEHAAIAASFAPISD